MGAARAALATGLALAIGVVLARPSPAQPVRALQVTPENARELLIGGPDAIGGVGDWYLANERIEAIVDDPSRRHAKLNHGGTLVDVGLVARRDEDQFARLIPLVNMSQRVVIGYDAIRAEVEADVARLVVSSSRLGSVPRGSPLARMLDPLVPGPDALRDVRVETSYEVRAGEPFVRIATRIENRGAEPAPVFAFGDLWMRGGRSMRAFVGDAAAPERSPGFEHQSFSRNLLTSLGAIQRFSHVAMAGLPAFPPVAYALFSPERSAEGLSFYGVTGEHVNLAMALRGDDPEAAGSPAWRLLAATREELPPGSVWEIERRLLVTPRRDVGSATDEVLTHLGRVEGATGIEGRSLPPDVPAIVHVRTASGHPITQLRAEGGRYLARLPPGDYALELRAPHRAARRRTVRVEAGRTAEVEAVHWSPLPSLVVAQAFSDGGAGRLVIRGRGGTPDPVFGAELLGFRVDGRAPPSATERGSISFTGNGKDPERIALAPGRYRVTATRGPEFAAESREVVLEAGRDVALAPFSLRRVVALQGYVSADLHVHAQASDDSGTTNRSRVRDFVAAGVDVIVASDHDHVPDYRGALTAEGLGERIRVVQGVEVTSSTPSAAAPWTIGHHNAWPVPFEPLAHRRGAPPSQEMGLGELYSLLRGRYGVRVVQLNHPRGKRPGTHDGNFFTHQGDVGAAVDTARPLDSGPNAGLLAAAADGTRAVDFDVIEVMNGEAWHQYRTTRDDFHWLLRQGLRRTAAANSDTHGPDELAGMPRNYVRVPNGLEREPAALDEALRLGRSFGTTGPLVAHFSVNGGSMGDTVRAPAGRVQVEYRVAAAPWVPVDEVRLLVNGEVVRVRDQRSGALELRLARDAFVTLEAGAPLDVDPAIWKATHRGLYTDVIAPGFVSVAFTNPVYVDVDGDGEWSAPGLRPPRRETPLVAGVLVAALALYAAQGTWRRRRDRHSAPGGVGA